MNEVPGFLAAFVAGLLSFLSPCVLPLIPSYLSFLTGTELSGLRAGSDNGVDPHQKRRTLIRSLSFSLGFTFVFVVLGIVLSSSSAMMGGAARTWGRIAGIVIILLGLNVAFDFLKFMNREFRFHAASRPKGPLGAFLFGAAFAAGWSPCVGPILASILLLAGSGSNVRALILLSLYSLGLAVPFILTGVFFGRMESLLKVLKKHMSAVKIISGAFLVLIGASMALGTFQGINSFLAKTAYKLSDLADIHTAAVRLVFSLMYVFFAVVPVVISFLRRKSDQQPANGKSFLFRPKVLIPALVFLALLAAEASGAISSAGIISSWLLFQGI